jgi:hypothetical protein
MPDGTPRDAEWLQAYRLAAGGGATRGNHAVFRSHGRKMRQDAMSDYRHIVTD